ncbi:MAG: hypothetical protein ACREXU_02665, partial [Gammaproteobacteria bacterium]
AEDQDKLRLLEGIQRAAEEWNQGGRRGDLLVHRDGRLKDAEALVASPRFALPEGSPERAYLHVCGAAQLAREAAEKEEQERRIRDAERIAEEQKKAAEAQKRIAEKQKTIARGILFGSLAILLMLVFAIWQFFEARLTRGEADAAALRREAETAMLRIEAGDVADGIAALGHALARDRRGILAAGIEVFRHWIAVLPLAEETTRATRGLLRFGGRVYARSEANGLVPLDVAEPFVAAAPWRGRIVAAGPGGIAVFDAARGAKIADMSLPPGTEVVSLRLARGGTALAVLARMTRVENDEDEPTLPIPCTALLLRAEPVSTQRDIPVRVRIVTAEGEGTKPMRALPGGDLLWHDCLPEKGESQAEADTVSLAANPTPELRIALDVPRIPEDNDILVRDWETWDEALRQAWPNVAALPVEALPALRPESALWGNVGETPIEPPRALGIAGAMDEAAIAALGLDEVEGVQNLLDVFQMAGFAYEGGRVLWGIYVCGNSWVCVARCTASAARKVSTCVSDAALSAIQSWQVYAPDARRFAHISGHMAEPPLTVFDIAGDARRLPDRQPAAPVVAAAFAADSAHLPVLTAANQLVVYAISADGSARYERAIGLGRGGVAKRCTGNQTIVALRGSRAAVLFSDCTLQLLDVAVGTLLWRNRLDVENGADDGAQVAVTADGGSLLVVTGGRVRLVHADTGAALSAPLNPADLPEVLRSNATRVRIVAHAGAGAPALDIDGRLCVRHRAARRRRCGCCLSSTAIH